VREDDAPEAGAGRWMMGRLAIAAVAAAAAQAAIAAPAMFERTVHLVGELDDGVRVFTNRTFALSAEAAGRLRGKSFFFVGNDDVFSAKVERGGEVLVMTAVDTGLSKAAALEKQGFSRIDGPAFQPFGANPLDKAGIWRKEMKAGETLKIPRRWFVVCGFDCSNQPNRSAEASPLDEHDRRIVAYVRGKPAGKTDPRDILVQKPDYVVYVPDQPISHSLRDPKKRGDSYNDHFQVIWDDARKCFYAFWTQASWEAATDQHICFSKSADRGITWTPPVILAGGETRQYPKLRASWQQPMLAKSGRLYCLWNQQTTSIGPHVGDMFGMYSDDQGESWSEPQQVKFGFRSDMDPEDPAMPPCWCNWQRPLRLGEAGKFFVGCSRDGKAPYDPRRCTKVDFWQFENIDDDPQVKDIRITCLNPDRRALSVDMIDEPGLRLATEPRFGRTVAEAAPVKLPDGRIFAMMRSSVGYPLWSVSADGGRTWSPLKALRDRTGAVMLHHCSPGPLYDWKGCEAASGMYFALVHNAFDFEAKNAYQPRGPLYLLAGRFKPGAEQPIEFAPPKQFSYRKPTGNSFYASYTCVDGEGVLWFNDRKYYLLGRKVGPEWFE